MLLDIEPGKQPMHSIQNIYYYIDY